MARVTIGLRHAPSALFAASVAAMVVVLGDVPARLLLHLLPYAAAFGAGGWALRRVAPPLVATGILSTAAVLATATAFANDPRPPRATTGGIDSPTIWSVTLQHPRHAILVHLEPPLDGGAAQWLVVRLAGEYRGAARVHASVNGDAVGALRHKPFAGGPDADPRILVADVPTALLARRPVVEVSLSQPVPDPALRIIAFRRPVSETLPERPSWFFDGERWHRGVVQPLSGRVVPGMPAVHLEDAA